MRGDVTHHHASIFATACHKARSRSGVVKAVAATGALLATTALTVTPAAAAASCEGLTGLGFGNATITLSQGVSGGTFAPPQAPGSTTAPVPITGLPDFCRVAGVSTPTSDSEIR